MPSKYIIDSDENSEYIYNIEKTILTEIGARAPCSEKEREAAEWIQKELSRFCDDVRLEPFYCHPRAFLGWIRVCLGLVVLSFVIFLFTAINNSLAKLIFVIESLALMGIVFLIIYRSFLCYEHFLAPLFKKKKSQNVVGTIKPKGEVKKRVIFSSHVDSAFQFNLIYYTRRGYAFFFAGGIFSFFLFTMIYLFQLIYLLIGFEVWILTLILNIIIIGLSGGLAFFILVIGKIKPIFFGTFRYIKKSTIILILSITAYSIIIGTVLIVMVLDFTKIFDSVVLMVICNCPFLVGVFFFWSRNAVPGAMDNLAGTSVCLCIAKILKEWKDTNYEDFPTNTEVIILHCGSEEVGLRGSRAFAERHADEYNKITTTCVNMDGISSPDSIKFFTREKTTRTVLDKEICEDLDKIANELGIYHYLTEAPGIGGGSDGAGLVMGGLRAATIQGGKLEYFMDFYHTARDNLEIINKDRRPCDDLGTDWRDMNIRCAMENVLKICLGYLKLIDGR